MKGNIYCPKCAEKGRKPKILGKYEAGVEGHGCITLFCKSCKMEVAVRIEDLKAL